MPAISRDRIDLARTGHACTTAIGCSATAESVFINGRRVLRPGDRLLPHTILVCCPPRCVGHSAVINSGSDTVFAEGRPISRKGDSADRGSMIMGSPNVFANGG